MSYYLIWHFFRFTDSAQRPIRYALERRIKLMPYIYTELRKYQLGAIPLIRSCLDMIS